ncbi:hypothetical protein SDC9_153050 [bioreactor metagenome]|uniref:VOC domain-containing protein n=1 Tax=bioreactor metagenome TaxID=1076179 RepID=A0A645EVC2_9ZZZZ
MWTPVRNKTVKISQIVTKIQHIGIPTNDIEKTITFYESLGFENVYTTVNEKANEKVAFLRLENMLLEIYQNGHAVNKSGAIDHIALDVVDINAAFEIAQVDGYHLLDDSIQFLPFWENGVKFFTILGPNGEKVEFNQRL